MSFRISSRPWPNVAALCAGSVCGGMLLLSGHAARRGVGVAETPMGSLAVFADTRTASDILPAQVADSLADSTEPQFSPTDLRSARRVLADTPGWLVPAEDGELCMVRVVYPLEPPTDGTPFSPVVTHACRPAAEARAGRLVETESLGASVAASPSARVVGVAPNGVSNVSIASSRLTTIVPVVRNAYEAIIDDPVEVRFVSYDNRHPTLHVVRLAPVPVLNAASGPSTGGGPPRDGAAVRVAHR
jgi:hypothetical protein